MRMQVSLTLPREAVSVPLARGLVSTTLSRAGVAPEIVADVSVALTEACTNAYQHVAAGDTYELRISLDDEFFAMEVVDRGAGFGDSVRVDGVETDLSAEDGRGIGLIRALTDDVAFRGAPEQGGGVVSMRKRVFWRDESPWMMRAIARGERNGSDEA